MRRELVTLVLGIVPLAAAATGCTAGTTQVTAIDLLKRADAATRRPEAGPFAIEDQPCGGRRITAQAVPVPSRLTWTLNFPARARLIATPGLAGSSDAAAEFRVGISDRRVYETLLTQVVAADACAHGGQEISIDLSRFGGRQWSLFYRPDDRRWELIFGVTVKSGEVARAFWGAPRVEADTRAARNYLARRGE